MINLILSTLLISHSLTISPLSFTHHNFRDKAVENEYKRTVSKTTTWHPGLHLKYEHKHLQVANWIFKDSFDGYAAGLAAGPKLDFARYFSLGLLAGVYGRVQHDDTPMKFPMTQKMGSIDISPIALVTGSVKIPIVKNISLDINAGTAWKITNFGAGLNFKW